MKRMKRMAMVGRVSVLLTLVGVPFPLTPVQAGDNSHLFLDDYKRWRERYSRKLGDVFAEIERSWSSSLVQRPGSRISVGSLMLTLPPFPELKYWFPPQLSAALAAIAETAHECRDSHYEKVALVSLSASIIAKWPNTLSYAMDIDHTRPHRRLQRFR